MDLVNLLKSKIGTDEFVSVYTHPDACDSFVCGQISYVDDDFFLVKHWTSFGQYDGYAVRQTEQVFRVDQSTYYENNIKQLSEKSQPRHKEYMSSEENCFIVGFLNFAKGHDLVVSIGVNTDNAKDPNLMGFVRDIDVEHNTVSVEHIYDYGNLDGLSTIKLSAILVLDCDGEKEVKFKSLYEKNNASKLG